MASKPFPIPNETLGQKFPMLSAQRGLPLDIRSDLALTDKEFGLKHKRGKAARLEALENMENRLQIAPLRKKLADLELLVGRIGKLIESNEKGFETFLATPATLEQAQAIIELIFLCASPEGLQFSIDPERMKQSLENVARDQISVDVVRKLMLDPFDQTSVADIAHSHGLGVQTIYDRRARLTSKLNDVTNDSDFAQLVDYLKNEVCFVRGTKIVAPLSHPVLATLLLEAGEYPSVHDIVSVAVWSIAKDQPGKQTFRRSVESSTNMDELVLESN